MAARGGPSLEYQTLLACTSKLVSEISQGPSTVSAKLLDKGFIPPNLHKKMQMIALEDQVKASELVSCVTSKVQNYPEKYRVFLEILRGEAWLGELVTTLENKYSELARARNNS